MAYDLEKKIYKNGYVEKLLKEILLLLYAEKDPSLTDTYIRETLQQHAEAIEALQPRQTEWKGEFFSSDAICISFDTLDDNNIPSVEGDYQDTIFEVWGVQNQSTLGSGESPGNMWVSGIIPRTYFADTTYASPVPITGATQNTLTFVPTIEHGLATYNGKMWIYISLRNEPQVFYDTFLIMSYWVKNTSEDVTFSVIPYSDLTIIHSTQLATGTVPYFTIPMGANLVRSQTIEFLESVTQAEMDTMIADSTTDPETVYLVTQTPSVDPAIPPTQIPVPDIAQLTVKFMGSIIFVEDYPVGTVLSDATAIQLETLYGYTFNGFSTDELGANPVVFPLTMDQSKVIYAQYTAV